MNRVEVDSLNRKVKDYFGKDERDEISRFHFYHTKTEFKIHSNTYFVIININKMILYFLH